jgi:hypothetical protein
MRKSVFNATSARFKPPRKIGEPRSAVVGIATSKDEPTKEVEKYIGVPNTEHTVNPHIAVYNVLYRCTVKKKKTCCDGIFDLAFTFFFHIF